MKRFATLAIAAAIALAPGAAVADSLVGSDRFLCSAATVTACTEDGDCFKLAPSDLNMPQFVEVDLQKKKLTTTKSSGMNRASDIVNLQRKDGTILMQGEQNGRAYSWMVNETLGIATISVAFDGFSVGVFGSCTPMTESK